MVKCTRTQHALAALMIVVVALVSMLGDAAAQVPSTKPPPQPTALAKPVQLTQSDIDEVILLVRTTMIAVHQANITGNYTVLRDLGAPDFRERNTAADLSTIFANIRTQRIDLSAAVLLDPHISAANLTQQKMLRVAGWFATKPAPVTFELLFQPVAGVWRIYGVALAPARQIGAIVRDFCNIQNDIAPESRGYNSSACDGRRSDKRRARAARQSLVPERTIAALSMGSADSKRQQLGRLAR